MDYFERLLDEKMELGERIFKLKSFIQSENFISVSEKQQMLLSVQLRLMESYYSILSLRVFDLKDEQNEASS